MIGKGAALGLKLTLVYWSFFVLAAAVRYGSDLLAAPPNGSLWPTYAAGLVSLAVASLGIALILGLAAAALGALTALAAAALDRRLNVERRPERAALAGIGVAAGLAVLLHAALWNAGLWSWSSIASPIYLFWLGAPALIYLAAAYGAGRAQA